ncbi:MAG: hypothetical protein FWE87_02460 [Coriobacteriia bacterium]|nr:hypothetical protein [Coriobacteriia bacterium]
MSRRSPLNKRYQKDTTPKGASKRSAASAKPVRKKGTQTTAKATEVKKAAGPFPDWEDYKTLRKQWWIVLGVSAAVLTLALILNVAEVQELIGLDETTQYFIRSAMTWAAVGLVAYSWYLDLSQLRPMMKAHQAGKTWEEYRASIPEKKRLFGADKSSDRSTDSETTDPDEISAE